MDELFHWILNQRLAFLRFLGFFYLTSLFFKCFLLPATQLWFFELFSCLTRTESEGSVNIACLQVFNVLLSCETSINSISHIIN